MHATTIDSIVRENNFPPKIVKIDVEGAECKAICGAGEYLQNNSAYIVMEYVSQQRDNTEHQKATQILEQYNYKPSYIDSKGMLMTIKDINEYLNSKKLESDNIVFKK